MKTKIFISSGIFIVLAVAATIVYAAGRDDLLKLRSVNEKYQDIETVKAAGYSLVPDLDYCFDNPGVGGMGYHYIDTASLDTSLDPLKPEAMVYAPDPNGQLRLAAVEYIVPADKWDAEHSGELPMVLGQHLHLNKELGVYVLHAWLWEKNPAGVFEDWNPKISCS
jgi:hypothetical protein